MFDEKMIEIKTVLNGQAVEAWAYVGVDANFGNPRVIVGDNGVSFEPEQDEISDDDYNRICNELSDKYIDGLDPDVSTPYGKIRIARDTRRAASALGRLGGSAKSEKKVAAVRENGKKGGRPRLYETITVRAARGDREMSAELRAHKAPQGLWISKEQYRSAEKKVRLIGGDCLVLVSDHAPVTVYDGDQAIAELR